MPISNSSSVFSLVKSLTKAEKRNFRSYATRNQDNHEMLFLQLFDAMDRMKELNEEVLIQKLGGISKSQISNLKRHLYQQILKSLRLIHANRIVSIEIREQIDYAQVLYAKGLFLQSLKILDRAKQMASKEELDLIKLQIVEIEKKIESRHITNTGPVKNKKLTLEALEIVEHLDASIRLSNLRVRLHSYYIKNSHVKSEKEKAEIITFFTERLPDIPESKLRSVERIYLYQCYVWYYYILLDFDKCYEYAHKWVQVFEEKPELKLLDRDLFMRGYHYLLTAAFHQRSSIKLNQHLVELQEFRTSNYSKFSENSKIFSFMYVHWARLNLHFLAGTYEEGVSIIPRTLRRIKRYGDRIAPHRVMVFYYKIAWMYLANGQPGKAVAYVNNIINDDVKDFREDIQGYSRLLYLMIHYDLENFELLSYLVKRVDRFFAKAKTKNKLQSSTLTFFKKVRNLPIAERYDCFVDFEKQLQVIKQDPYELRAFMYLDIVGWVQAKIERRKTLKGMAE